MNGQGFGQGFGQGGEQGRNAGQGKGQGRGRGQCGRRGAPGQGRGAGACAQAAPGPVETEQAPGTQEQDPAQSPAQAPSPRGLCRRQRRRDGSCRTA